MFGQDTDNSRASILTLIIAFVISAVFLISNRGSDRLLGQTTIGAETSFAPALALLSRPLRAAESFAQGFQDRSRAVEENKALREELYILREEKQRADIRELKLRRLEQILKSGSGIDIPTEKIAVRAVSEIDGPFVRSALINAGRNKGIKKGHPVMTVHGLYGHILHSGPYSARVLKLGDLNSRVSVMSGRSSARAIVSGNNSEVPILAFVDDRADWQEGDMVLSSGDDGVLPQGLPIGEVKTDDANQLTVSLGTTGKPIDWVWVYPFTPTAAPEDVEGAQTDASAEYDDESLAVPPEGGSR